MKTKTKAKPARKPAPELPAAALQLLEVAQIAAALRLTKHAIHQLIAAGEYPRPDFYLGRLPRWRVATHNAWVQQRSEGA